MTFLSSRRAYHLLEISSQITVIKCLKVINSTKENVEMISAPGKSIRERSMGEELELEKVLRWRKTACSVEGTL